MQLIVLGMHRSGTSLLARLLNLMGAYFGPEGSNTGANAENPKGFWERKDVRAINDAVLFAAGCDWNRVAGFDPAKVPTDALVEFRRKAGRLVMDMDAHRPWLLKEPRLCLLMSLWRPLLEAPVCIHVFRDPDEVAMSLQQRNQMPIEAGLALWERHVADALRDTQGLPSLHIGHAELIADPVAAVARLHAELTDLGVAGLRLPSAAEVTAFVDTSLHRQKAAPATGRGASRQGKLYKELLSGGAAKAKPAAAAADDVAARLADYEATLPAFNPPAIAAWDDASRAVQAVQDELALARGQVAALEDAKLTADAERRVLRDRIAKLESELVSANSQASRVGSQASAYAREIDLLRKQLADDRARLDRAEVRRAELEASLRDAEAGRTEAEVRLKDVQPRLVALEASHAAALEQALSEFRSKLDDARHAGEREAALRKRAEASLAARFQEIAKLTRLLVGRDDEIKRLRGERTLADWRLGRETQRLSAERDALRERLDALLASRSWRWMRPVRGIMRRLGLGGSFGGPTAFDTGPDLARLRDSTLFDAAWYLETYPDVRRSGIDPAVHYLEFGAAEGRDPGPAFSTLSYLSVNDDVARAGANPLVHYLMHGKKEGRKLK